MALPPAETLELFDEACTFPADEEAVVEAVGDVTIEAQNGDSTAVATLLERSEETSYASARALHSTVLSNLPDEHVGRKHYDDRSTTRQRESELSF